MWRCQIKSSCEVQASCNRSNKSRVNKWRYAEQINCDESLVFLFPIRKCKVQIVQLYTVLKKTTDSVSETLCFFMKILWNKKYYILTAINPVEISVGKRDSFLLYLEFLQITHFNSVDLLLCFVVFGDIWNHNLTNHEYYASFFFFNSRV
jgi:hypothetical protein